MVFVVLFVAAMLLVPVMIDVERHGSDNVLRKSGRDILEFKWVAAIHAFIANMMRPVRVFGERVTDVLTGTALSVASIFVVYIFFKVIDQIFHSLVGRK